MAASSSIFSQRLRYLMKSRKCTYKSLALSAELSSATIANYLSGDRSPRAEELARLANSLGVTMDYLWGREESCEHTRSNQSVLPISRMQEMLTQLQDMLSLADNPTVDLSIHHSTYDSDLEDRVLTAEDSP